MIIFNNELSQYPFDIDVNVVAQDGDDAIGADIKYSVVPASDYFKFDGTKLQQTKDLTQEMILDRLVAVVVQVL